MKAQKAMWVFLAFVVTALNTWAAYMTATYCCSMTVPGATGFAVVSGVVTFVLALVIISS
jgi:hypothetical protein